MSYTSEDRKARYHYLKSRHRCTKCGKQDAFTLNGRAYCAECNEKCRDIKKAWRQTHQEQLAISRKARDLRMKESGRCVTCGKKNDTPGRVRCSRCLAKYRKQHLERRKAEDKYSRLNRIDGECYFCGKPVVPGKRTCQKHLNMCRKFVAAIQSPGRAEEHPWRGRWKEECHSGIDI